MTVHERHESAAANPGGTARTTRATRPRRLPSPLVVVALLLVALVLVPAVALAQVATPHAQPSAALPDGESTPYCAECHRPHLALTDGPLLAVPGLYPGDEDAVGFTELTLCYTCHGGLGPARTDVKNGPVNAFESELPSGHVLEATTPADADLTNSCSSCHDPHGYSEEDPRIPRSVINGVEVTGADTSWCLACHNDESEWYAGTLEGHEAYPQPGITVRDPDTGYPVLGTFPGATVYTDTALNAHARIPATTVPSPMVPDGTPEAEVWTADRVEGDCLWCHAAHRAPGAYDGLLAEFGPSAVTDPEDEAYGDYAQACFECHGNSTDSVLDNAYWSDAGAADLYVLITAGGERSGHRIETAGGLLEPGAPLPCYECHGAHGSALGNTALISDELGGGLDPSADADAESVRHFCFTCHTTADTGAGWVSDGNGDGVHDDGIYVAFDGLARQEVVGLPRDSGRLSLPAVNGHYVDDPQSCYNCHGNIHNPTGGLSMGGADCYGCHSSFQAHMEYDGASRFLSYHHVLGTPAQAGDTAFLAGEYPTSAAEVYCLSCHVDHDKFNDTPGANLRVSINSEEAANTDFSAEAADGYGICLSCHSVERVKRVDGYQAAGGSTVTPAISGADYAGKAHDYAVETMFGTSPFYANCVKCHDDEQPASFQRENSLGLLNAFRTHWSADSRIASPLLAMIVEALEPYTSASTEETLCFACHTAVSATEFTSLDGYGTRAMSPASQRVALYFTDGYTGSGHDVTAFGGVHTSDEGQAYISANKHVECEDCHNVHVAGTGTRAVGGLEGNVIDQATSPLAGVSGIAVTWPTTNWTAPAVGEYSAVDAADKEYQICFKCHSSANTGLSSTNVDAAWYEPTWTNVALEFNPANESYHPVVATARRPLLATRMVGGATGTWGAVGNQTMYCSDCHGDSAIDAYAQGPHGSATGYILKGTWNPTVATLNTAATQASLCTRCHGSLLGSNANRVHSSNTNHQNARCSDCHIIVPHGGKVPRLLATTSAITTYPRYVSNPKIVRFQFPVPTSGTKQSCVATCHSGSANPSNTYQW